MRSILALFITATLTASAETLPHPTVTGTPRVYTPDLLAWEQDVPPTTPDLSEPTSNRIYDLHMQVARPESFDLIISTSGNYHMALTEFWHEHFVPRSGIQNWFFSTSPSIGPEQAVSGYLSFGNVALRQVPHLVVGPKAVMAQLREEELLAREPTPLFTNRGNVLLIRKGNPKQIRSLSDLARGDVRVATSNPNTEPGSFGNYASSLYSIQFHKDGEAEAKQFFADLFGGESDRWVVGERIHHREVPHLIYSREADVAPIFYHLARYLVASFPEVFDFVPLGGTKLQPEPLKGNKVGKLFIAPVETDLSPAQETYREQFLREIETGAFDPFLEKHHINPIPHRP